MKNLLIIISIFIIIIAIYYIYGQLSDPLTGMWVGAPKFIEKTNIVNIGANFANSQVVFGIVDNNHEVFMQIYKYKYSSLNNTCQFIPVNLNDSESLFPAEELKCEYNKQIKRIIISDENKIYMDLLKIEDVDSDSSDSDSE